MKKLKDLKNLKNFKPLLGAVITALVVLLAATIPALFVRDDAALSEAQPLTTAERAELFALYREEDARCAVEELQREAFSEEELAGSGDVIRKLRSSLRIDRGEIVPESTGERFFLLGTADGRGLRMREYYEQSAGDWSNWFRVYVDIDTQEVFFLYQSSKCLKNEEKYPEEDAAVGAKEMAELWIEYLPGCERMVLLEENENMVSAAYLRGDEAIYYDTRYTTYTSPEYVVDFRFAIRPPMEEGQVDA